MSMLSLMASVPSESSLTVKAISMPGVWEWLVILVIVLVVFGPNKLPQIGEALGRSIKGFKKAVSGQEEIDVTPSAPGAQGQLPEGAVQVNRVAAQDEQGTRKA